MAAFDFPSSPNNGDTYSANGIDWIYNGTVWKKDATAGVKGQKGEIGVGDKGQKGQKGEKGEIGDKGQKGEIGATGGTGGVGDKGQKGEASTVKGDKGQKGEIGPAGGSGGTGNKGDKGQKGENGADGGSGADGSDGDKGQKGATGGAGSSVPSGGIIIWSGASNAIPSGWYLCNGSNGTPDLRDRFVIGAGNSYAVNATGGSKDATLVSHSHTIDNHTHSFSGSSSHSHTVNNHTHSFSGSGSNTHSHNIFSTNIDDHNDSARRIQNGRNDRTSIYPSNTNFNTDNATISISISGTTGGSSPGTNSQTVSISGTTGGSSPGTNSQGSSATNANLPPYYALCYIMKS